MKKRLYIALVLGIAVICLSQCRRVPFCYYVPQDFWNDYFPYEIGDTVIFRNEFNEIRTYAVEYVHVNFGLYEPYTDDAHPTPHCSSCASVKLSNGEETILFYFTQNSVPQI